MASSHSGPTNDDGQLDQIMQQLRVDDELGEQEGYRWVHSVVNAAIPGDERVGEKRVRAAVKRAMPAAVAARNDIIETRLKMITMTLRSK